MRSPDSKKPESKSDDVKRHLKLVKKPSKGKPYDGSEYLRALQGAQESSDLGYVDAVPMALSALIDPDGIYRFRFAIASTLSSSAGGSKANHLTWDPSQYGLGDYTAAAGLFYQCRLHQAIVTMVGENGNEELGYILGSNLSATTSNPSTVSVVTSLADCRQCTDSFSSSASHFKFKSPVQPNSLWGLTATPASGGVDTGCYGAFQMHAPGTTANNQMLVSFLLELFVDFRSRG